MPYNRMSTEECYAFCSEPVRPAILSTVRANGRAHSAPIWYALDGAAFVFNTGDGTVKGRNLRHQPFISLCVQDDKPPFSYVTVEGVVEIIEDMDAVKRWAAAIGGRYMGANRAAEYGARNAVPGEWLIRVEPIRVTGFKDVAG